MERYVDQLKKQVNESALKSDERVIEKTKELEKLKGVLAQMTQMNS